MKRLTLLRHAKSSWADAALDDHNRPLNERGWKAARRMGRELTHRRMSFDLVLASTAARVRETIDGLQEAYEFSAAIRFEPRIYLASVERLVELVREIPDEMNSVLLVGHNPAFEQFAVALSGKDDEHLRDRIVKKFPTAALAAIELPIQHWEKIEPGIGRILDLIVPRELED